MKSARDALALNRQEAISLAERVGVARTRRLLEGADRDLTQRIRQAVRGPGKQSFTYEQLKTTLAQVRGVLKELKGGMQKTIVGGADEVAEHAAGHVLDYLEDAQHAFGLSRQPLALKEAAVLDAAREGARASVLRRLASSGELVEGADEEPHPAKIGVLDRYGMNTIANFEETLQRGLIGRKSLDDMRSDLIGQSPFLQKAPASWAERIVRTEVMGSYGRASFESVREADDQLGDMVKILAATFDDRTAADSYAVHGEIRRPDEAFQNWYGLYQHPPGRPNDREIVVPHRMSWPLPPYLRWKTDGEIAARWRSEGRKVAVPPRPKMTTVPLSSFGK